jgi:HSP20 family protein
MKELRAMKPGKESEHIKLTTMNDFFDRVRATYDSIARRAYEIFESNGKRFGHDLDDWFQAESELLNPVRLEVREADDGLMVQAELPGFKADEIEVNVEARRLTITGKRETQDKLKKEKTIYAERRSDQILRVVDLPMEVDTGKVTATLKGGVLELKMPKAVSAKQIKAATKTG